MRKGKVQKENKDVSIMIVPHFSKKFKIFQFKTPYSRVLTVAVVAFVSLLAVAGMAIYTSVQNEKLSLRIQKLTDISMTQRELITDRTTEIEELKKNKNDSEKAIQDFASKYKELTEKYINAKTNRSGDRTDSASFVEDITGLKELLNKIGEFTYNGDSAMEGLSETESKLKAYVDSMPTNWPISGKITSKYGDRQDPFLFGTKFHSGLDIAAGYGESIVSAGKGKVIMASYNGNYGNCVMIDHGYGLVTVYGHSSKLLVKVGDEVEKGQEIAKVGSTGRSTGPHLHFEVRLGENVVDPMGFLGK